MNGRFSFKALPIPVSGTPRRAVWPEGCAPPDADAKRPLLLDGRYSTISEIDDALRFQAIGSCPVPFRGSLIRVIFFKLLGTGVLAGLTAAGSSDSGVVKSCALAAAVNTVACVHYLFIWRVRIQAFNIKPLDAMGVGIDRSGTSFADQAYANAKRTFVQEIAVDSLRHSDWIVTVRARQRSSCVALCSCGPAAARSWC